jgi:hypothetical protein
MLRVSPYQQIERTNTGSLCATHETLATAKVFRA